MTSQAADRRRSPRLRLQVPLFLRGIDAGGEEFLDLAKTLDISATGACVASTQVLAVESLVLLTIPAPSPSGGGLLPPSAGPIKARVRRLQTLGEVHFMGVEFLKPIG